MRENYFDININDGRGRNRGRVADTDPSAGGSLSDIKQALWEEKRCKHSYMCFSKHIFLIIF